MSYKITLPSDKEDFFSKNLYFCSLGYCFKKYSYVWVHVDCMCFQEPACKGADVMES